MASHVCTVLWTEGNVAWRPTLRAFWMRERLQAWRGAEGQGSSWMTPITPWIWANLGASQLSSPCRGLHIRRQPMGASLPQGSLFREPPQVGTQAKSPKFNVPKWLLLQDSFWNFVPSNKLLQIYQLWTRNIDLKSTFFSKILGEIWVCRNVSVVWLCLATRCEELGVPSHSTLNMSRYTPRKLHSLIILILKELWKFTQISVEAHLICRQLIFTNLL